MASIAEGYLLSGRSASLLSLDRVFNDVRGRSMTHAHTDPEERRAPADLAHLGYAGSLLETAVARWEGGKWTDRSECIVEELPVAIVYNGIPHVVMMATPADLEDFALGFSLTEELIGSPSELAALQVVRYGRGIEIQAQVPEHAASVVAERSRRFTGPPGCGICRPDTI